MDGRGYLSSWLKGNKLNLKSYYKAKMSLTCSLKWQEVMQVHAGNARSSGRK